MERVTGSVLRWLRAQSPVVLAMLGAVGLAGSLFVADVLNVTHVFRGERRFYVSTKAMETDRAWGLRQGAKDYIVKPPDEGALIGRINELLGA